MEELFIPKKIVLIVDDEPDIHHIFHCLYSNDKTIDIQHAKDGYEGVEKYRMLCKSKKEPTLVLMDLNMPGLCGFECAKKILTEHTSANIYAFTANYDKDIEQNIKNAGMRGIISKDNDFEDIHSLVQKNIKYKS
jgi:two-component system, NarL family, invasion response regulator UvrY